jgi:hypothetical protein
MRCGTEQVDTVSIDDGEITSDGDGRLDDDGGDARPPIDERNVHEAGTQGEQRRRRSKSKNCPQRTPQNIRGDERATLPSRLQPVT